ncbi:hypothetical protein V1508DRAFT_445660 [Lipomyces doorenjongii]|uniref:uncharacterized protein n=1 Tax=Lipomyces doorenjongii TaxID=383834 RepID=UPI0034D016E5
MVIPSWILGAVKEAAMNILYPLSVYAAVQRHLGKPLDFPGDIIAWDKEQLESTAMMNSYFSEWVVLTDGTSNESLNIVDDYRFNWGRFWPVLARWYGLEWSPPAVDAHYTDFEVPLNPRGYGPKGKLRFTFNLIEWASRPETQNAWAEIAAQNGITHSPFDDPERVWTPADVARTITNTHNEKSPDLSYGDWFRLFFIVRRST